MGDETTDDGLNTAYFDTPEGREKFDRLFREAYRLYINREAAGVCRRGEGEE